MSKVQPRSLMALYDELETLGSKKWPTPDQSARMEEIGREIRYLENLSTPESSGPPEWTERSGGVKRSFSSVGGGNGYRHVADEPTAIAAHYIRSGDLGAAQEMHAAAVDELRASNNSTWNITTNTDGGYAVPTGHHRGIIARRDEMMLAPRLGVRRIPGSGTTVNVVIDDEADGEFVTTSEQNDAHENNYDRDQAALNVVAMTLSKKTKKVELTEELLYDEDSQLMAFIEDWVGRGFARTHNSMLLTEVLANGTAGLTLDSATTIGAAEVPEFVYLLPEEYEDGAAWVMKRSTESILRQKVGDAFQFAPNPAGTDQARRDLWGHPLYTSQYMGSAQASGKSLLFGNFNFVGMREAPTLTLLRDPYSVDGMLVLKYSFRAVYKVLQAEALIYATHPTA